jgi:hypothetical protein
MHSILNLLWKHVELLSLTLILLVDFIIRINHFKYLKWSENNNKTETILWTYEVKHFLMPLSGNYIQEPISKFLYNFIFSHINIDRYVLANLITFTYALISIPVIWLLSKTERKFLLYRQLGCVIFQARNVMDYLDGAVIRNGKVKSVNKGDSIIDYGLIIDALANAVSALCFFIGTFLYIWKKYSQKLEDSAEKFIVDIDEKTTTTSKYDKSKLVSYIFSFLVFFIMASLGWDFVLTIYTKEVIYNQVIYFVKIIYQLNLVW